MLFKRIYRYLKWKWNPRPKLKPVPPKPIFLLPNDYKFCIGVNHTEPYIQELAVVFPITEAGRANTIKLLYKGKTICSKKLSCSVPLNNGDQLKVSPLLDFLIAIRVNEAEQKVIKEMTP